VSSAATSSRVKTSIGKLELVESWYEADPSVRVRFGPAFDASSGAASSSTLYLEVPVGHHTPWHTHSAEEVVFIVTGRAEAGVGEERVELVAGDVALIPAHVPHALENVSDETLGFIGFFAAAAMVHVFDQPLQPFGTTALVTPPLEQLRVPLGG
jgi:quercetin dioxygenase-like cupin family protein